MMGQEGSVRHHAGLAYRRPTAAAVVAVNPREVELAGQVEDIRRRARAEYDHCQRRLVQQQGEVVLHRQRAEDAERKVGELRVSHRFQRWLVLGYAGAAAAAVATAERRLNGQLTCRRNRAR